MTEEQLIKYKEHKKSSAVIVANTLFDMTDKLEEMGIDIDEHYDEFILDVLARITASNIGAFHEGGSDEEKQEKYNKSISLFVVKVMGYKKSALRG